MFITSAIYLHEHRSEENVPAYYSYIKNNNINDFGFAVSTIHDYISGGFKAHTNNPTDSTLPIYSSGIETSNNVAGISFRGDTEHMCLAFLATID